MQDQIQKKLRLFYDQFPLELYGKGTTIFRSNSQLDYFFFVEEGSVKMTTTSDNGKTLVLHIFYPGSCFSLLSLISDGMNKYDFITMTSSKLRKIGKDEFISFLKENTDVLFDFQIRLLKGMQGLLDRIEQSNFISAYQQVAGLLIYFLRHFSEADESSSEQKSIQVRLTHQEIADWLGLSRENVSIQMKLLERNKIIATSHRFIEILDLPELHKLANPHALI
jgi:CRP-like cAMP-binding protein